MILAVYLIFFSGIRSLLAYGGFQISYDKIRFGKNFFYVIENPVRKKFIVEIVGLVHLFFAHQVSHAHQSSRIRGAGFRIPVAVFLFVVNISRRGFRNGTRLFLIAGRFLFVFC